jgi:ABC-type multidrug transport system fused ATPase/permease subunit
MVKKIFSILETKSILGIVFIALFTTLNSLLELISISFIVPILSFFSSKKDFTNININFILDLFNYFSIQKFSLVCLLFIFVFLIKSILSLLLIFYVNKFNYGLYIQISNKIFKNYLFKDYSFHLNNHSSKILIDINNETNSFVFDVIGSLIQILIGLIFLIYISIFLFFLDKFIFISLFSFFIFIALLYSGIFSRQIKDLGNIRYKNSALAVKQIQESLGGIKEVILLNVQNFFLDKYNFYNKSNAYSNMKSNTIFQIPRILFELLVVIFIVIYLFFFTSFNSDLTEIIIILSTFVVASSRLIPSINRILSSYQNLKYKKKSVEVIFSELNAVQNKFINLKKNKIFLKNLYFEDVSFKYNNSSKYIFKSLNFRIEKGDKIGIQGNSGVGKTTFVNLICGLASPTSGKILINNHRINIDLNRLRGSIGYVPQKVFLLDDSIKNNIIFGRSNKDYKASYILNILRKFKILEFIENLDDGIDTIVGENGQKISGGQAQRIGIARALLHNPSLLILDESTSSLDLETEKTLIDNIYFNFTNLTIVSISHRLSALKFCNKVYEVKSGSLNKIK